MRDINMHTDSKTHTHTHTHAREHTHKHTNSLTHTHTYTHTHMHIYIYIYMQCTFLISLMYLNTHTHTHIYIYIYICSLYIYIYIGWWFKLSSWQDSVELIRYHLYEIDIRHYFMFSFPSFRCVWFFYILFSQKYVKILLTLNSTTVHRFQIYFFFASITFGFCFLSHYFLSYI